MFEENVVWFSHGTQYPKKDWFLFPFKSLTFMVPNNTFSMNQHSINAITTVCNNKCHRWIKMPVVDVLNKKYKVKYSLEELKLVQQILLEELYASNYSVVNYLHELNCSIEVFPNKFNDLTYNQLENMLSLLSKKNGTKIKKILSLNNQVQLIHLRDMKFQIKNDAFKDIYGIWKCHEDAPELLSDFTNDEELFAPSAINLADLFYILENTLKYKNIDPSTCNIKLLCCRNNLGMIVPDKTIRSASKIDGVREGTLNGKKWSAMHVARDSTFQPLTFTKYSESLNNEIISIPENRLSLYINENLPDLDDGETSVLCRSYKKQPVQCDHTNTFKKQLLIFHPDKNNSCPIASTRKFQKLINLCRSSGSKSKKLIKW